MSENAVSAAKKAGQKVKVTFKTITTRHAAASVSQSSSV